MGRNLTEQFLSKDYSVLSPTLDELDLINSDDIKKYLESNPVETVIHCATTARDGTSYPENTCENNLRMFFNIQRLLNPSVKMINLGSGSEYSRTHWHQKMPEEFFDRHIPQDSHSYSKYLISKYIIDINSANLVGLRIFGIYGKYEDYRYKFISNSIAKNLLKLPIVINQNVIYDYIYILDFFRVVEYFVNNHTKCGVFNVTPTKSIDLVTIADLVNQMSENKSDIRVLNEGIGVEYSGDNRKLISEIRDFDFMSYEEAISDLYHYYKDKQSDLDPDALEQDAYLQYAKNLRNEYFRKGNEK